MVEFLRGPWDRWLKQKEVKYVCDSSLSLYYKKKNFHFLDFVFFSRRNLRGRKSGMDEREDENTDYKFVDSF